MKRALILLVAGSAATSLAASIPSTPGCADGESSPIFGVTIPNGYRQWELIGVAHEQGLDELRSIVGNDIAMKAFWEGTLLFPDGAILVKLAGSTSLRARLMERLSLGLPRPFKS